MKDLISKSAALDNAWQVMYKDEWHMTQTEQVISVNDIETLPTIDAVPVVRCKDCKHYEFADNRAFGMPVKRCEWTGFEDVDDNDFCSRGERSEDGET